MFAFRIEVMLWLDGWNGVYGIFFLYFYTETCSCLVVYLSDLSNICMLLSLAHAYGVEVVPFMLARNKSESNYVGNNCVHSRCSLDFIRLFNAHRTE